MIIAVELREPAQDRQDQPPVWRGGVRPGIAQQPVTGFEEARKIGSAQDWRKPLPV
jgi:hypothetical protein